jgi:hypothetical protein
MFAGSLVMGVTVLCFAAWLHWNDTQGWPSESFHTELDNQYRKRRSRSRKRIHMIIAACGIQILVAAFSGPGRVWVAAWTCVIAALMTVMVLAGFDAFRTHRYQKAKLPEIRGKTLNDDE